MAELFAYVIAPVMIGSSLVLLVVGLSTPRDTRAWRLIDFWMTHILVWFGMFCLGLFVGTYYGDA